MKVAVIWSGGMDSTTLVALMREREHEVLGIGFDYGQRHRKELWHARALASEWKIPYHRIDISHLGSMLGSALTTPTQSVPLGHYADESMKATVVPNRNMIMLAIATGVAISHEADELAYAAHAGDHTIYPDCRPEFVGAMRRALFFCHFTPIGLMAPFVNMTKAEIVAEGARLGVPYEKTYSCYIGGQLHCGRCGTCTERREAFTLAGVPDPTSYYDGGQR